MRGPAVGLIRPLVALSAVSAMAAGPSLAAAYGKAVQRINDLLRAKERAQVHSCPQSAKPLPEKRPAPSGQVLASLVAPIGYKSADSDVNGGPAVSPAGGGIARAAPARCPPVDALPEMPCVRSHRPAFFAQAPPSQAAGAC